jgi:hypothetical protein
MTGKNINELASNLDTLNSIISWCDTNRLVINKIISWCDTNRLIINKDKSLAFGFHHKLNKNIAFPDIILKDRETTYD